MSKRRITRITIFHSDTSPRTRVIVYRGRLPFNAYRPELASAGRLNRLVRFLPESYTLHQTVLPWTVLLTLRLRADAM